MRIAIFADLHGKLLLPFKLVDLYQQETGEKVDLILQCGDLGAYPNLKALDKATLKHARYDRDELGFYEDFAQEKAAIKAYLQQLDLHMICVRGNHEDHDYLDVLEQKSGKASRFPIDVYQRVWVCKTGHIQTFRKGDKQLSFVGIGRIGDRKRRTAKRFIQEYERKQLASLFQTNEHFDILLSHDKDDMSQRGYGMPEIRHTLDQVIFHYHFYGHTGEPFQCQIDSNGITTSCKIKELEFSEDGTLPEGCMIILHQTKKEDWELTVVPSSLTDKLTKTHWKD
ncbi:metallophosphoesterase [Rapidithrix thailandica]|uniref:Metallophosphoesterase n=1 Tax=Rapidithrix thailandica TaxID=413964 RepID=A0AAW9RRI4_9BACT